ncbi:MAG: hypothetical protein ABI925_00265 [Verrucomicrobiota bacterium]
MVPFRNGRGPNFGWVVRLLSTLLVCALLAASPAFAKTKAPKKRKNRATATPTPTPGQQGLTNVPLPVGHEAKGLVLPDFDTEGRLRGKFEAGTAKRLDEGHMGFQDLKITTYTQEKNVDLQIDMRTSVLDLKTQVLSSQERTTVRRVDFNIVGDSVQFDTVSRTGRLIGNVKMVITDKSQLMGKKSE